MIKATENSYTVNEVARVFQRSKTWVYSRLKDGLLVVASDSREFTGSDGPRAVKVTKASVDYLISAMAVRDAKASVRRGELVGVPKDALLAVANKFVPWRERPLLALKVAAEIIGLSVPGLYRFNAEGKLHFKAIGGRTLVDTPSLIALIESAPTWVTQGRGREARAKRAETKAAKDSGV